MFNRSRSLSPLMFALLGLAVMLGPAGCASGKPREKWWQFWRPKVANLASIHNGDITGLPPPPDVVDANGGKDGSKVADANGGLPEVEPLRQDPRGMINDLAMVHFAFDSSDLDSSAQKTLDGNAQWLQSHAGVQILIEGHCDERGTVEYNYNLGQRRANAVKSYLVQHGIGDASLHTISYGEERPLDMAKSEDAFAKNRRAQFLVY